MAKGAFSFKLEGSKKLQKALADLGKASRQRKVLRQSLNKASTPVNREAKRRAPRDTGTLRKSIGKVSRTYSGGSVVVVIGARTGFSYVDEFGNNHEPVNYAHLVEFGHAGPFPAEAHPFLRPAYESKEKQIQRIFNETAWEKIKKEAERVANKAKKK